MRMLAPVFLLLLVAPRPAAAAWPSDPTANVPLCVAPGYQSYPEAVSDGKGGAIVAWQDLRGASLDLYVQRVDATGAPKWSVNGVLLCGAVNDQYTPRIASDGAGGAIVTWMDYRSGTTFDVYAQRVDSSGTIKWAANGVTVSAAANFQSNPDILADGSGGAIITWDDDRALPGFTRIFAQRLNASGTSQWTAGGVALNNSPAGQSEPRIASNGAGGAIVVWLDARNGRQDFYAQRILSNGVVDPAWPLAGRAIAITGASQEFGGIVPDGSGGALISWMQMGNGLTRDIHVLRVLASSALDPAWPALGRKLVADSYDQSSPSMMSDGSGGTFVAWDNYRSSHDIFAHHVLATGALDPAWPDTGLALCTDDGDQGTPRLVPGDSILVVWVDERDDAGDVYAQRFFRSGIVDPQWPADGRAICTANLRQLTPTAVSDGTGGAVVAWEDRRTAAGEFGDEGEIFAQGIKANGQLGDPPVGVPGVTSFDFELRSANPVRANAMTIRFTLPRPDAASIELFNVAGRRVASRAISGEGPHAVDLASAWDPVPGVYFVRLSQGTHMSVRRLVILD